MALLYTTQTATRVKGRHGCWDGNLSAKGKLALHGSSRGRAGSAAKPGLPYLIASDLRERAKTTRDVGPRRPQHAVMIVGFCRLPRSLAGHFILGTLVMNKLHGPLVGTHVCVCRQGKTKGSPACPSRLGPCMCLTCNPTWEGQSFEAQKRLQILTDLPGSRANPSARIHPCTHIGESVRARQTQISAMIARYLWAGWLVY